MTFEPMSNIACQAVLAEDNSYGGWLKYMSQGRLLKSVRNKYVVMQNKNMYIYSSPTANSQNLSFALPSYSVESSSEIKDERWGFKLVSKDPEKAQYIFAAPSKREREEWMERITQEISYEKEYDYAMEEQLGLVGRILTSRDFSSYESPPAMDGFTGPILPGPPINGRVSASPPQSPDRRSPPLVPARDSTENLSSGDKTAHVRRIAKQRSEHLPPRAPKREQRKLSEPCKHPVAGLRDKKPMAPPRPMRAPKPQSSSPPLPILSKNMPGFAEHQQVVTKLIHDAKEMHKLVNRRDCAKKNIQRAPEVKCCSGDSSDSDDEPDYLECTNEEEEQRLKVMRMPRGEPDGKSCRSLVEEKDPELDPLPPSAVKTHMCRTEVEELLQNKADGTYVIRKGTDVARVLTIYYKTKIRHFKIFEDSEGGYLIEGHPTFRTDRELVQYYYTHNLPTDGLRLSMPYV